MHGGWFHAATETQLVSSAQKVLAVVVVGGLSRALARSLYLEARPREVSGV